MNSQSKYNTKQRRIILEYLKTVPGVHVTVSDACEYFKAHGESVGQATVYRQLEKLVDEGVINKYNIDSGSPACFEYTGHESHGSDGVCFHCKCEKCGKLIHMHCDELKAVGEHLLTHDGFKLNPMRTVFYGICEDCLKSEE
jgi:Fur family ferric uptake transcriptional regulator